MLENDVFLHVLWFSEQGFKEIEAFFVWEGSEIQ